MGLPMIQYQILQTNIMRINLKTVRRISNEVLGINNGNWAEWNVIWAKIVHVISKLNKCTAQVWFEITSMISDQNCMTQGSITTLLNPFWNCPNTGLGQFKHFIDAVLSRSENSSISWGEKVRVLETKVAKFATWYSLSFIFLQFDWLL